ncbi:MAG: M48 family metallopeptidase [Formosimonas sp.]
MNAFSALFIGVAALYFTVKWYLSHRQMQHIVAHQNAVPSPFAGQIDLAAHQKAAAYALERHRLGRSGLLVSMIMLWVWTLGGGLGFLAQAAQSVSAHPLHFGVILMVAFSIINALVDLPLSYVAQFKVEQQFGFNRMTLRLWLSDLLKGTAVSMAIGVPLLYAVLALVTHAPDTWWLWAWALFVVVNLLLMWLYPTFIAPLFNKFKPLEATDLKTRLDALLTRCGFTSNGMFVMDGSKRSGHGNAYFTGFGRNKRIVFFDTLLAQLSEAQIEAVLAHELGHFHHKHIIKRMAVVFPLSLAAFALLGYVAQQAWFYSGLGMTTALPAAHLTAVALILFSLVLPLFTFVLTPILSHGSRRDEFEADAFAVAHSNGQDLIDALVNMYQENASFVETDPLYSRFYDSHPPALIRMAHIQQLMDAAHG